MGWYDYLTDITSSLTIGTAYADQSQTVPGPEETAGEMNKGTDVRSGGMGTAQQDRDGATKGGASTISPASGTDEESGSEAEANEKDAQKQKEKHADDEPAAGHKPGDGGEGSGQLGPESAGPHGQSVKALSQAEDSKADDDEEEADEEEEEEDEPVDPKTKIEEDCMKTQQCGPLKHHYDECAERVMQQHEQHGKAHEDCVEEYFHLMHCATQCAAPKLWKQLR